MGSSHTENESSFMSLSIKGSGQADLELKEASGVLFDLGGGGGDRVIVSDRDNNHVQISEST